MTATAIAIGPWAAPYEIRSVKYVHDKYGKPAARGVWLAVAIIAGGSGIAILNGVRPAYAAPSVHREPPR
ncbi:hypothetical protein [Allorhodopirellula heiligendammensis]|uniref:hypothetical protein n=1 Tax=Allorhodopirellula heiligendammensis TaxID=2714739 RepID=UPI00265FBD29|nr:hypothetical protein [Allorhodopirellula heiligendammensis]